MIKKKVLLMVLLLTFTIVVSVFANGSNEAKSGATAGKTWTMKISHAGPVSDLNDDYVGSKNIKEYIEKNSNGQVKVEIYSSSQLGSYEEVMEQLDAGVLEAAHVSIGGITPFLPELSVVDLQYFIPNDKVVVALMHGPFFEEVGQELKNALPNATYVAASDGGRWRSFFTTNKEVKSAEDLKGLKIRTISSPLQQEFTNKLGAASTPIAWDETYTSLSSGIVDGLKIATPDVMSNNLNEVLKYAVLDRHTFLFGFYFISQSFLDSLPKDIQKVVTDGIKYGADKQTAFNQMIEESANEAFVKGGGAIHELTNAERETFYPARDAMKGWYVNKYGTKWLDKFENAVIVAEKSL